METNKEISALFTLIDDPDEEVFGLVSEKIVDFGSNIIPNLEHLWETTPNEEVQNRIELLIHRLHLRDLTEDFLQWSQSGQHELLPGSLLTCKFQYPEMSATPIFQEIEKVRRNIWLELNNYLTPLEQIKIVTSILFSYYGLKGVETNYNSPNEFLLHKTLESKKGNQISNGVLYLILCEKLDIPVKAIKIPNQFILAFLKPIFPLEKMQNPYQNIDFFIDPTTGQVFTQQDVENYFKRISVIGNRSFFKPQTNIEVIQQLMLEYSKCFKEEKEKYKQIELLELSKLLNS